MKISVMRAVSACLVSMVLFLSGCTTGDPDTQQAERSKDVQIVSTISVEKRRIAPMFSTKATVEQAKSFVLSTSQRGPYRSAVKVNDSVKAGQVLGWNNGVEIKSPVDAIVRRVGETSEHLPMYYPVFELEYQGFAFTVDAPTLLSVASIESLTGKFQIENGLGPTEIKAILASPGDQESLDKDLTATVSHNTEFQITNAEIATSFPKQENLAVFGENPSGQDPVFESGAEQGLRPRVASQSLVCLIDKNQPVHPGQAATVVLNGQTKADVLAIPVSAVAGRTGKGAVTLVKGENSSLVEVGLGVSDGAYIEITSGLSEGDVISTVAPNLDPRKK